MKYYRKALRLVPDIDKKIFKKSQFKESTHNNNDQGNKDFFFFYKIIF